MDSMIEIISSSESEEYYEEDPNKPLDQPDNDLKQAVHSRYALKKSQERLIQILDEWSRKARWSSILSDFLSRLDLASSNKQLLTYASWLDNQKKQVMEAINENAEKYSLNSESLQKSISTLLTTYFYHDWFDSLEVIHSSLDSQQEEETLYTHQATLVLNHIENYMGVAVKRESLTIQALSGKDAASLAQAASMVFSKQLPLYVRLNAKNRGTGKRLICQLMESGYIVSTNDKSVQSFIEKATQKRKQTESFYNKLANKAKNQLPDALKQLPSLATIVLQDRLNSETSARRLLSTQELKALQKIIRQEEYVEACLQLIETQQLETLILLYPSLNLTGQNMLAQSLTNETDLVELFKAFKNKPGSTKEATAFFNALSEKQKIHVIDQLLLEDAQVDLVSIPTIAAFVQAKEEVERLASQFLETVDWNYDDEPLEEEDCLKIHAILDKLELYQKSSSTRENPLLLLKARMECLLLKVSPVNDSKDISLEDSIDYGKQFLNYALYHLLLEDYDNLKGLKIYGYDGEKDHSQTPRGLVREFLRENFETLAHVIKSGKNAHTLKRHYAEQFLDIQEQSFSYSRKLGF